MTAPGGYAHGDHVAVFDELAQRWRSAVVIAARCGRLIVATAEWWGYVPARAVRPIRLVGAA